MPCYVVEIELQMPSSADREKRRRIDRILVTDTPPRGNLDHEPVVAGWAGTTNDVAVYGHGEHPSLEAAMRVAARLARGGYGAVIHRLHMGEIGEEEFQNGCRVLGGYRRPGR